MPVGVKIPGRWIAAGGSLVVGSVVAVALVVQNSGGAACAAPPTGDEVHQGKSTFYTLTAQGNCSYPQAPDDGLFVALGPDEYSGAAACGGYLDVTGPDGKVRVKIIDQCPECAAGHIDLSAKAFARIADPVRGIVPVTYRAVVNPPKTGPLTFRIKEGSSEFFFAVLVDGHGNPLRSVEAKGRGGEFRKLSRKDFNYWIDEGGLGAGPYSVRVTDVYGRRATATGVRLAPGQVQRGDVSLSGGGSTGAVGGDDARGRDGDKPRRKSPRDGDGATRTATPTPSATASAEGPDPAPAAAGTERVAAAETSTTSDTSGDCG